MENTWTVRLVPSKIELFVSFGEEFKLKYCRKSPKTTIFRYRGARTVRHILHSYPLKYTIKRDTLYNQIS